MIDTVPTDRIQARQAPQQSRTPGNAQSNLVEVDRRTPGVVAAFEDARQAFVTAAANLERHRLRFEQRSKELKAAGDSHGLTPPPGPELVTKRDVDAAL